MAGNIGSLKALLSADSSAWSKGFTNAGKDVDRLKKKTGSFFKDMSASSTFGQSMRIMAGGGAVAALTMAGSQIKNFADNLIELRNELNAGTLSAGEFAEKLAGSIPVIGQFWQAGRSIRELFTGEQAEIARINAEAARTNSIVDYTLATNKAIKKSFEDEGAEIRKINRDMEKLGKDPFTSRKIDLAQRTDDQQRSRASSKQSEMDDFNKDDAKFKEFVKQRDDMKTKLDALKETANDYTPVYFGGPGNAGQLAAQEQYNTLKDEYDKLDSLLQGAGKRRAERLKEINDKYNTLDAKDKEKAAAEAAQIEIDLLAEKNKTLDAANESLNKTSRDLKLQQLKEDGQEEQAAIQQIINETADAKAKNLKDANDKLKGMGISKDSGWGQMLMQKVQQDNEALDDLADSKIAEYTNNRRKSLIESIDDPIRKYQDEVKKWNSEVQQGIVTQSEADSAIAKLRQQLNESLGMKESPVEKLKREIAELQKGVELHLVDPEKAKKAIEQLSQEAMPKAEYKAAETHTMRFDGRVQAPVWPTNGPLDQMSKTAIIALEETRRMRKNTDDMARVANNTDTSNDVVFTIPG